MTITIGQVIDRLLEQAPVNEPTVDSLRVGSAQTEVTGIVVVFLATQAVIEQAAALGVNLIISHEGTFYRHQEDMEVLQDDPVINEKRELLDRTGIAIYRYHDHIHRYKTDGIMMGLINALGWAPYVEEHLPAATVVQIPCMTLERTAQYLKEKLQIPFVRVVGEIEMSCTRIGLLAGYRGGAALALPLLNDYNLDLVIAGEGPEWETPEYIRDAVHQGKNKAYIALGHAESEEPGMKELAERLQEQFPGLTVHFIREKPLYHIL
ncbi:Nif3-like dinuclear metal center hexameric protein [Paenibacillus sp. Soil724D2]|uniref:Nif3-like dinuclear metal center hexameric protein n=1 Tax=Paenibacillus sp. (strain Soil724D2) TaxID=1736392 RepID=UPI000713130B|nr:Nif3-like dinuclear metal center hexameric protein [Paenibacillus sp. Soil724D2]KRE48894.1 transcriptional regulator [Paenibacillus sp. Soil724D2]